MNSCCVDRQESRQGYVMGAHGLSHSGAWKQGFVESRRLAPVLRGQKTSRRWLHVGAYQPVDVAVKYVEEPIVKVVEKLVPRIIFKERVQEVPVVEKVVQRVIRKPCTQCVDRYEVRDMSCCTQYAPQESIEQRLIFKLKPIYQEKIIFKEKPAMVYVDRYVEIPQHVEELCFRVPLGSRSELLSVDWGVADDTSGRTNELSVPARGLARKARLEQKGGVLYGRSSEYAYTARCLPGFSETAPCRCVPQAPQSVCRSSCCQGAGPP
ncbi:alveolin domain containing intermediate filament imc11 [Cystoisospora suis]|uniref:Alveolin domain containing intermediate filament imc11 n=1 Tax=Cystoisospora suis TaxID=483139 RepID=A0A2C6JTM5_9APIC|nr:alveolin domain containing intermediate filament imc11 [Cystoisospora suis]